MLLFIYTFIMWTLDVNNEREEGTHSTKVQEGLKIAMLLFIASEVLFFAAWFWGYFHSSLSPINELGNTWPPRGVIIIDPYTVPVLNTLLLLRRGISVTWAHHNYMAQRTYKGAILITVRLGALFTTYQVVEYNEARYRIADSIYGAAFYVTTGFHGAHVLIGTLFLTSASLLSYNINPLTHCLVIEFAIWYWHFVDVVWLFLITFLYLYDDSL